MKTLTLIIAAGALLAVAAPTAGAKNTLHCTTSAHHSIAVRTVSSSAYGYQLQRNLLSAGSKSCGAATSAKTAKSQTNAQTPKAKPQTQQPVIQPAVPVTPVPSLQACADAQTGDDYVELGVQNCPDPTTAAPDDATTTTSTPDDSSTTTSTADDSSATASASDDSSTTAPIVTDDSFIIS
jgi:hypothetical protein